MIENTEETAGEATTPTKHFTLSDGDHMFPAIGTKKHLLLMDMAMDVLTKLPNFATIVEQARLDYAQGEARAITTQAHLDGLAAEDREKLIAGLSENFPDRWYILEELSDEDREALENGPGITAQTLAEEPSGVQISTPPPSAAPMFDVLVKLLPELWYATKDEVITATALVHMPNRVLDEARRKNCVAQTLAEYRLKFEDEYDERPGDFIQVCFQTVQYAISELIEAGGDLGKLGSILESQAGELLGVLGLKQEPAESDSPTSSKRASSTSSSETTTA